MSKPDATEIESLREELAASRRSARAEGQRTVGARGADRQARDEGRRLESTLVGYADENALLKRRLFGTKSERGGTSELQLSLEGMHDDDAKLQAELDALQGAEPVAPPPPPPPPPDPKDRPKPKGRRDLSLSKLPQMVVEIKDESLEEGAKRIGFEESRQLMYRRGGFAVLVKRTAKYEVQSETGPTVLGVEMPESLFPRSMLHTTVFAWLATQKFSLGVPHHRLEQHLRDEGEPLGRSAISRAMEELGSVLGATVVHAALEHARTQCNVLSTDATGAAIQPGPSRRRAQVCMQEGSLLHRRRRR